MDLQVGIVARVAPHPAYLARIRAAEAARSARFPVLWVKVEFRPGFPEVSPRNKGFSAVAASGGFVGTESATDLHPDLEHLEGDLTVVKKRVSAFAGSDPEVHRVLIEKVFPRQAEVIPIEEWSAGLG